MKIKLSGHNPANGIGQERKVADDNGNGGDKETGKYIFVYKMKGEQPDAT
jgi:hypothetical protein